MLADLPVDFVGTVEGHTVPLGGSADVVVTDGVTGNVVLKAVEGAVQAVTAKLDGVLRPADPAHLRAALAEVGGAYAADTQRGAVLLGVDGVVVVGHGRSAPAPAAGRPA